MTNPPSAPDVRMSSSSPIWLVASREIVTRLRAKAFIVSTVAMLMIIIGGVVVLKLVSGTGGADSTVGFTGANASLAAPLEASGKAIDETVATEQVSDEATGRAQVGDGSLDALLVGDGDQIRVVVQEELDNQLGNALNVLATQLALNQQITDLGGDPAQVNAAVANAGVDVSPLEQPYDYNVQQLVLGMVAGILIYLSLQINGQYVAQGVVEEKTSRVVELLLSTVRPWQLLAGKVLGIGIVGLIQVLIIGVVGMATALAAGILTISVSAAATTVIWLVVWYLLGYFMYSIMFAGLGALVSRQEDVGGAIAPALVFVMAGYFLGIIILPGDPGNTLVEVVSVIPVFAPTLMPMRLAMGGVPVWEAGLSIVLVVALIPTLIWFAGRIYRNAVMRTGAKVKLGEALRAAQ